MTGSKSHIMSHEYCFDVLVGMGPLSAWGDVCKSFTCWASKNQPDSLPDCWTQSLHPKDSVQSLHRKSSEAPTAYECIIIPVRKIAGILIELNPQLDPTSSIWPNQNEPVTQEHLKSLKTNSSIQYLFSITYDPHLTSTYTVQRQSSGPNEPLEFACANYLLRAILKTILKISYAKYWDVSYPIWQACRAQF